MVNNKARYVPNTSSSLDPVTQDLTIDIKFPKEAQLPREKRKMCNVSDIQHPRCQCGYFEVEKLCSAGFSSVEGSCRNGKNQIVRSVASEKPICEACIQRMERTIRAEYSKLTEDVTNEGLYSGWNRQEVERARERLKRGERGEIAALRSQCA